MVPAIVLIAVIGAAIFGGGRSADDPSNPERPTGTPESVVDASFAPDVEALRAAGFPTRALGLPVHSVARTMALRDEGEIQAKVVAVAGWLTVPPEPDCGLDVVVESDGPYGVGADCRRSTVLTDDAEPVFAIRGGEGTRLRACGRRRGAASAGAARPVPGRGSRRTRLLPTWSSGPSAPSCSAGLAIPGSRNASPRHRTAVRHSPSSASSGWRAAGACAGREIYPADVDPVPSGMVRWPIIDRAIRRGAIVLTEVIVERDHLATIDPTADAVVPRDVDTIWYVRALLRPRGLEDSTRRGGVGGDRRRHGRGPRVRSGAHRRGIRVQPARGWTIAVRGGSRHPGADARPGGARRRGGAAARRQRARA